MVVLGKKTGYAVSRGGFNVVCTTAAQPLQRRSIEIRSNLDSANHSSYGACEDPLLSELHFSVEAKGRPLTAKG
jgi:hypothetical protein